jgi:hypothetical protein
MHVPSNVKLEFQGAKNACGKCLYSGETTAFQSCCSLILLNFNLQTWYFRARIKFTSTRVSTNCWNKPLCHGISNAMCITGFTGLAEMRKETLLNRLVCYHFKVFISWQTFPCCHTNYLNDINLDIQLYRYMAFGPNPDHINQLKNRKPNENTSHRILEERWKTFTFTFSTLHTTLRAWALKVW